MIVADTTEHSVEVLDLGGELVVSCDQHGELGRFAQADYPKWRLALHAAEDLGNKHTGVERLHWRVP